MTVHGALTAAWIEARRRVFGSGFDRSFRLVLLTAYAAGALFLAHRSGGFGPAPLLAGFVAAALFLAMPLVTIFAYVLGLSFVAARAGVAEEADPPMPAVLAAFAGAMLAGALFTGGAFALPVVGAQLRTIFS